MVIKENSRNFFEKKNEKEKQRKTQNNMSQLNNVMTNNHLLVYIFRFTYEWNTDDDFHSLALSSKQFYKVAWSALSALNFSSSVVNSSARTFFFLSKLNSNCIRKVVGLATSSHAVANEILQPFIHLKSLSITIQSSNSWNHKLTDKLTDHVGRMVMAHYYLAPHQQLNLTHMTCLEEFNYTHPYLQNFASLSTFPVLCAWERLTSLQWNFHNKETTPFFHFKKSIKLLTPNLVRLEGITVDQEWIDWMLVDGLEQLKVLKVIVDGGSYGGDIDELFVQEFFDRKLFNLQSLDLYLDEFERYSWNGDLLKSTNFPNLHTFKVEKHHKRLNHFDWWFSKKSVVVQRTTSSITLAIQEEHQQSK